jgi:hypothetical protein
MQSVPPFTIISITVETKHRVHPVTALEITAPRPRKNLN